MALQVQSQTNNLFIVGPALKRDNGVLEAICSLQYLPTSYKLILPAASPEDSSFRKEIMSKIEQSALRERVLFSNNVRSAESPEAFASAVLALSRPEL